GGRLRGGVRLRRRDRALPAAGVHAERRPRAGGHRADARRGRGAPFLARAGGGAGRGRPGVPAVPGRGADAEPARRQRRPARDHRGPRSGPPTRPGSTRRNQSPRFAPGTPPFAMRLSPGGYNSVFWGIHTNPPDPLKGAATVRTPGSPAGSRETAGTRRGSPG